MPECPDLQIYQLTLLQPYLDNYEENAKPTVERQCLGATSSYFTKTGSIIFIRTHRSKMFWTSLS